MFGTIVLDVGSAGSLVPLSAPELRVQKIGRRPLAVVRLVRPPVQTPPRSHLGFRSRRCRSWLKGHLLHLRLWRRSSLLETSTPWLRPHPRHRTQPGD
eukprot:6188833-Pleurochrysis_carterae.AAC.1